MPLSTSVRVYPMKVLLRRSLALATICLMPFVTVTAKEDVKADPGNMTSHKEKPTTTSFEFQVTGATSGPVWGTDHYTLDSRIAVAAVHSGAVKQGETAVVVVTLTPGRKNYTGSTRNGVKTGSWGAYEKSYQVKRKKGASSELIVTPANLQQMSKAAPVGTKWKVKVTGKDSGSVWGTDNYTLDSKLAKAVVHAGLLKIGESGTVLVTVAPGLSAYKGTERNGVRTSNWGAYEKSYQISALTKELIDPGNMTALGKDAAVGTSYRIKVTGIASGALWGTDHYTLDSKIAKAAVHAGVLKVGEAGVVTVTIKPGQESYTGQARNGVQSSAWGSYAKSYSVSK